MTEMRLEIEESWGDLLKDEFNSSYFDKLKLFLTEENQVYAIYPEVSQIFAAFNHTPVGRVKVVILGQDPYHGEGQAHGLSFSVPDGVRIPQSLKNIFKELSDDLGVDTPISGNLQKWAEQGVLLLNATLTVRQGEAGSHQGRGWEVLTDRVIQLISDLRSGVVFLLWGKFAQNKANLIDTTKHFVLKAPHPSPLSVYRGYYSCKHFSKANDLLEKNGLEPIDWDLNMTK
jgi:uracil-DNA glycosylase